MELDVKTQDGTVNIRVIGTVDEMGSQQLGACFQNLDAEKINQVVLDFGAVTYIGSAGVGKLLLLYKKVALTGGSITVEHLPSGIYTLLAKDMNLGNIFTLKQG